jgi:hypothetical protein
MAALPVAKSFQIAWQSLRVRFLRSLITVGSLVLAVTFLGFVLVGEDISAGLLQRGGEEARIMLHEAGYDVPRAGGSIGLSPKERWIVALSLLVCTVGIVNAQLMAVAERFREIGVMKCLGALDRVILRLFIIEAGLVGLTGAAAGALLGLVFALLQGLVRFGWQAVACLGPAEVAQSVGISLAVGIGLSVVGVLYPAILAARMRPVVALNTEH